MQVWLKLSTCSLMTAATIQIRSIECQWFNFQKASIKFPSEHSILLQMNQKLSYRGNPIWENLLKRVYTGTRRIHAFSIVYLTSSVINKLQNLNWFISAKSEECGDISKCYTQRVTEINENVKNIRLECIKITNEHRNSLCVRMYVFKRWK